MNRITFNKRYFSFTLLLFVTEVLIALHVHDSIIRPYVGDILVVMLLYCFIKSFVIIPVAKAAAIVVLFAFAIELLQGLDAVHALGLSGSKLARTVIGTSFEWTDLGMYLLGIGVVLFLEENRVWLPTIRKK